MTIFTVEIKDEMQLAGVSAARVAHNIKLSTAENPIATDAEYMQFVMTRAVQSYATQHLSEVGQLQLDKAQLQRDLDDARAELASMK